jgi:hypothetical protein
MAIQMSSDRHERATDARKVAPAPTCTQGNALNSHRQHGIAGPLMPPTATITDLRPAAADTPPDTITEYAA